MSAALHPLDLPELAAALWRTAFFVLACAALGQMVAFIRWPGLSRSRRILMSSLAIATLQPVVVNVQRWGEVIYLEGLPVQTVYVLLGLIGVRVWITETTGSRPPTRLESATMNILDTARDAWRANPVRVAGYIAALVVFLAAKLGVVIDEQDLVTSLLLILPVVLGVEKAQGEVMPVTHLAASGVYLDDDKGDRNAKRSRPR